MSTSLGGTGRAGLAEYFRRHTHQQGIIVCPEKKFIYMKPTKTAGTSILRGVLEKQGERIIHRKDHPKQFSEWVENITDQDLRDYFIFAIVRNPWDRALSIATYFDLTLRDFLVNFNEHIKDERIRIHSLPLEIYTHNAGDRFVDMVCRFESLQEDMNRVFDQIGLRRQQLPHLNSSGLKHYTAYFSEQDIARVGEIYAADIENYEYTFR